MSEIFNKAVKKGLQSLEEIPSPFEVARKLGLNIPTMKDIEDILSFVGPQADIKAMVEESSRVVPALKKGDIPEAISSLGLAALAPFMIGIPGTVSGIRKGTQKFTDVVKIPYRRRNIYLRFRAEGDGKNFDIKSYEDKNLLNRAWQPRYDDRIFDSEEEFMKTYNRIKKKEIKEPSSPSEGLTSLGEPRKIKAKPEQKKPDVENLGEKLATAQQVGPERTMLHVLNAMHESDAGYAAGYLVEHIGDLTRKMGNGVGVLGPVKLREIKEKVGKGLRKLRYGNVEGEFNESMKGKNVKKLNKLFEKYADEHSKLPIFNKPQWLAREAAVSVGKKDFNRTRELLEELEILIDNPNNFYKLNSSIDPAFSSKLKGSSGLSSLGEK